MKFRRLRFSVARLEKLLRTKKVDYWWNQETSRDMVKAVTRLLQDKEFARGIGAAGRERIGKIFSCDHMVEEMKKVYREVCSR